MRELIVTLILAHRRGQDDFVVYTCVCPIPLIFAVHHTLQWIFHKVILRDETRGTIPHFAKKRTRVRDQWTTSGRDTLGEPPRIPATWTDGNCYTA